MKIKSYILEKNSNYLVEIGLDNKIVVSKRKIDALELKRCQASLFRQVLLLNYNESFKIVTYE